MEECFVGSIALDGRRLGCSEATFNVPEEESIDEKMAGKSRPPEAGEV